MARELSLTEQAFKLLKFYEEEELQDFRQLALAAYRASALAEETSSEMDEKIKFEPKAPQGVNIPHEKLRKGQADMIKSLRKQHAKEKETGGPAHKSAPDANYLLRQAYKSAGAHKLAAKHGEPPAKSAETPHQEPGHKAVAQAAHAASREAHSDSETADNDRRATAAKVARNSHKKAHDAHVAAAQALTKGGHYSTAQDHIQMARHHAEKASEYHQKAARMGHEAGISAMKAKSAAGGGHYSKGSWVSEQKRLMGYNEYPTLEESVTLADLDDFESDIRSWRWKQRDLMGIGNHYPSRREAGLEEAYEPPSEEDNIGERVKKKSANEGILGNWASKTLSNTGKEASLLSKVPGVPKVAKLALKGSGAVNQAAGSALSDKPSEEDEEAPQIHFHMAPGMHVGPHPGPIGHDFHAPPGHDDAGPEKKPGLLRRAAGAVAGGVKKELGRNIKNLGHAAMGYATGGKEGAIKALTKHGELPMGKKMSDVPSGLKQKVGIKDEAVKTKMRFLRRQAQKQMGEASSTAGVASALARKHNSG